MGCRYIHTEGNAPLSRLQQLVDSRGWGGCAAHHSNALRVVQQQTQAEQQRCPCRNFRLLQILGGDGLLGWRRDVEVLQRIIVRQDVPTGYALLQVLRQVCHTARLCSPCESRWQLAQAFKPSTKFPHIHQGSCGHIMAFEGRGPAKASGNCSLAACVQTERVLAEPRAKRVRLLVLDSIAAVFRDVGDGAGVRQYAARSEQLFQVRAKSACLSVLQA